MSEWKFLTLKEVELEFIDGDRGVNYPKKSELLPEGDCVFLNTGNVRQNSFDFSNLDFITKEKDNLLRNGKLQRDDIVLTTRGTVGNVALYSQEVPFSNIRINSGMVIIRVNKNFWHPYFIYLFFQSHLFKKQISRLISGSAQPQLPISILETVNIPQLTLDEQKEIIFNIKSIDQKIQINNQINQELEAMAKTLYDYWFVQFDFPDQNGKPYKSSGGKMVYHPELKREIPEGWGVEKLGDIETNIVTGKTPSRSIPENFGGDIPFITIGDIRGNTFIYSSAETLSDLGAEEQNKKYLPPNSLCVSCIATVGEIGFTTQLSQTNQQINSIIFNDVNHMYFLYFALKLFFESSKTKTGNTFANMSKDDFSKILIIYPDSSVIKNYYEKVKSMFDKIKCLQLQNQELTQLRDWLLPMLMNGQVKVEDKT